MFLVESLLVSLDRGSSSSSADVSDGVEFDSPFADGAGTAGNGRFHRYVDSRAVGVVLEGEW